jgi:hypothetical protein
LPALAFREVLMRIDVLAIRAVMGLAGAWLLLSLFFEGWGIGSVVSLAALMVAAAYIVEMLKRDRTKEQL